MHPFLTAFFSQTGGVIRPDADALRFNSNHRPDPWNRDDRTSGIGSSMANKT